MDYYGLKTGGGVANMRKKRENEWIVGAKTVGRAGQPKEKRETNG